MFVHPKHIIESYEKIEEDFSLHTAEGECQGLKGDYLARNVDNDMVIISQAYVDAMEKIEIKPQPRRKKDSPFVSAYMRQLSEMSKLDQNEDDGYIKGEQNGWILDSK